LSSTTDIHKTLTSEKNKNDKELKDVDQKLKQLFLAFSKPQIATGAEIASYFQNLLETVYDDDNIINSILFTPFEDFGRFLFLKILNEFRKSN